MDRSALILMYAISVATPAGVVAAGAVPFELALARHLRSVSARDLPALERSLTRGDRLNLFLPDGRHLRTRREFVALHRGWFAEEGWTMRFEPVSQLVGTDLAVATVRTNYDDVVDGKPYHSENWLSLTFRREDGSWRLVQDQNTRALVSEGK